MNKLAFIISALLLNACTTTNTLVRTDKPKTETPEYERLRVAYLGKDLLSYNDQTALTKLVLKKEMDISKRETPQVPGTVTAAVTLSAPILSGESLLSHSGMKSASVAYAGMFAIDTTLKIVNSSKGRQKMVSRFYMPEMLQGKNVGNTEEAFATAQTHTLERFDTFANQNKYSWSCYDRCEDNNKLYFFKDNNGTDDFYVLTKFLPFEKATGDSIIHSMLGSEPKWESKSHNGWSIMLLDDVARNPDGSIIYKEYQSGMLPERLFINFNTQNRRNFLREITSTGHIYQGIVSYGFLTTHGSIYAMINNTRPDFITYKIND